MKKMKNPPSTDLSQELLSPEQAEHYYKLGEIDGRLVEIDRKYRKLLPDRQAWQNGTHRDLSRLLATIGKMEREIRELRIEANDLKRYRTIVTAPWKREAVKKKKAAAKKKKASHRSANLAKARRKKADNRVSDALKSGDLSALLSAGQSKAASPESASRAMVAAAAQTFLSAGLIDAATFKKALNENWSSEKLMAACNK